MDAPIAWLLAGESWVEYRTRRDLLGQLEDDPQVVAARARLLTDPQVQQLMDELAGWPGAVIASHKSAGQPFHKLTFLADLGLRASDPQVAPIDAQGRFALESVWTAWKDWEFGQKRAPSRWLTLLAWRIMRRVAVA